MLWMCFWLTAEAQAIFDLTASQVKIDSLLPVFTWQKQLGPRYMDSTYTVSIAYPEFIDMSEAAAMNGSAERPCQRCLQ